MATTLYMVIEHFRGRDPVPVYRRFRDRGRLTPAGLHYVGSWVSAELDCCYQLMRCDDRALLEQWMGEWADLIRFEVVPVLTSPEAVEAVAPRL